MARSAGMTMQSDLFVKAAETFTAGLFTGMVTANAAIIVARLLRQEKFAEGFGRFMSRLTWALRMGDSFDFKDGHAG